MSPGTNKHTHPYLKQRFYTLLDFWENVRYTERAKNYYRNLQAEEQTRLDRKKKQDSVIWQLPH